MLLSSSETTLEACKSNAELGIVKIKIKQRDFELKFMIESLEFT